MSQTTVDINAAMLAGFALNSTDDRDSKDMSEFNRKASLFTSRGWPMLMDPDHPALSGSADFKWLL